MHTTVIYSGKTAHHSFHADRAIQVRPTVEPKTEIIDGVEHYIGTGEYKGKIYRKDLFDQRFQVQADRKIKSKKIRASREKAELLAVGYED